MTSRERWLGALEMRPLDRLPFWPKLDGAYPNYRRAEDAGKTLDEHHRFIGSDRHVFTETGLKTIHHATSHTSRREGDMRIQTWTTPRRELVGRERFDARSHSWHPMEFPVKDVEDIRALTQYYRDLEVVVDPAAREDACRHARQYGDDALIACGAGTTAFMNWVEHLAGVENAHFFLMSHEAEVEELFDAMQAHLRASARLLAETMVSDVVYFTENTSTTLASPEQYRRYCFPHLKECCAILHGAGRRVILHMCGHLKALLPDLGQMPVCAFEAFTAPPVGNTTLLDGRANCPNVCLVGGTSATLWTKPAHQIIAQIEKDLDALPHHRGVVVTSAGVMPPMCEPETIRKVCQFVQAYPARW